MSFRLMSTSSTEDPATISNDGNDFSRTSISTTRGSRDGRPAAARGSRSRVRLLLIARRPASSSECGRTCAAAAAESSSRSSAFCAALARTSSMRSSRTMSTPSSTRSRTIDSDVAADVADLRELRGFDLHERRLRERAPAAARSRSCRRRSGRSSGCSSARSLPRSSGAQLLPPHAVAERDRDRAFRCAPAR